ncbi:MAG: MiaB/RimO family radical SAM methylthiotransferase, partial [Sphingobacteriia bacterium]
VDAVLGAAEKFRLFEYITEFQKNRQAEVHHCTIAETRDYVASYSTEERTRAFLKVQDGCDYKCTFCTIPLARGHSRSDTPERILAQARHLVQQGVQEIVLTGINIGDYGVGQEAKLIDLIRLLDAELTELPRIRISSIEPNLLTDEMIDFVAHSQRFMPHFHLPLQSGSNAVLAIMRRRYRRELYAGRVQRIKQAMPHAAIGCDVLVGFSGETDDYFEETYHFIKDLPVSYLHVFPFSERTNTLGAELPGHVPLPVRQQRADRLRMLSEKLKHAHYAAHLGQQRPVLFEDKVEAGMRLGWTDNYVRVALPTADARANGLQPVRLAAIHPDGYVAGESPLSSPAALHTPQERTSSARTEMPLP